VRWGFQLSAALAQAGVVAANGRPVFAASITPQQRIELLQAGRITADPTDPPTPRMNLSHAVAVHPCSPCATAGPPAPNSCRASQPRQPRSRPGRLPRRCGVEWVFFLPHTAHARMPS